MLFLDMTNFYQFREKLKMPKTAYANASSAVALSFAAIFFTDQVSHEVFFAVFHHFSPIKQATSIPYTSLLKSHINTVHLGFFL